VLWPEVRDHVGTAQLERDEMIDLVGVRDTPNPVARVDRILLKGSRSLRLVSCPRPPGPMGRKRRPAAL
jgi:hypothetical protein